MKESDSIFGLDINGWSKLTRQAYSLTFLMLSLCLNSVPPTDIVSEHNLGLWRLPHEGTRLPLETLDLGLSRSGREDCSHKCPSSAWPCRPSQEAGSLQGVFEA
jgi:hypothetical protein